MALGYARSRPPLHRRIVEMVQLPRVARALDIGCGSGLSTRALEGVAAVRIGIEPVEAMVRVAPAVAPGAGFVHGAAERLPFRDASFNLVTAAGSLNYVDLDLFFPEVRRVLARDGSLLVYDFSQGRSFRDSPAMGQWFDEFVRRYPPPPGHARPLSPAILAGMPSGLQVVSAAHFDMPLRMTATGYADYIMTETNVSNAIAAGASAEDIRSWCVSGIDAAFAGAAREVLFPAYLALMQRP